MKYNYISPDLKACLDVSFFSLQQFGAAPLVASQPLVCSLGKR